MAATSATFKTEPASLLAQRYDDMMQPIKKIW